MATLGFAGKASAEAWVEEVEALNADTELLLKNVGMCLQDIGQDGHGSAIDSIVSAGTEMINSTAVLVTNFKKLSDIFRSIIADILGAITDNDSLLGAAVGMIGKLGN